MSKRKINSLEILFTLDIYADFYQTNQYPDYDFIEWLCQENLIGQELTPEIYALWELSKDN